MRPAHRRAHIVGDDQLGTVTELERARACPRLRLTACRGRFECLNRGCDATQTAKPCVPFPSKSLITLRQNRWSLWTGIRTGAVPWFLLRRVAGRPFRAPPLPIRHPVAGPPGPHAAPAFDFSQPAHGGCVPGQSRTPLQAPRTNASGGRDGPGGRGRVRGLVIFEKDNSIAPCFMTCPLYCCPPAPSSSGARSKDCPADLHELSRPASIDPSGSRNPYLQQAVVRPFSN